MKRLALAVILVCLGAKAHAAQSVFDIGYSTFAVSAVGVTTGTVVQINVSRPTGFSANVAAYRLVNQDATYAIWCGGSAVAISGANRGEKLAAGASVVWPIGKNLTDGTLTPIYCIADSAATATSLPQLSIVWFGH